MKFLKLFISSVFVLVSVLVAPVIFAEEAATADATNTNPVEIEKTIIQVDPNAPKLMTLVSDVSIFNSKIISQEGNNFKISFDFNNGKGIQNGVKYGVKLIGSNEKGQYVADEKVYTEALDLYENTSIHKEISYIAPSNLNGEFVMYISSKNANGFPFSTAYVSKINLTASTRGIHILSDTCYLSILGEKDNKKYNLTQGVDISKNETIILSCEVVNKEEQEISVTPNYKTTYRTAYGDIVPQEGGSTEAIILKAGDKTIIALNLPKTSSSQAYDVAVSLQSGNDISNSVTAHYVLQGNSATLQNISLDKDYYKEGDMANLSFFWSPQADMFPGNRADSLNNNNNKNFISVQILNGNSSLCGEKVERELFTNSSLKIQIPILINSICKNPQALLTLKDGDGNILSEQKFEIETISQAKKQINSIYYIILIAILVIIGVFAFLKNKKNKERENKLKKSISFHILFPFLVIMAIGSILPFNTQAAFDVGVRTGYWVSVSANLDSSSYDPGSSMYLTVDATYNACSNTTSDFSLSANGQPIISSTKIQGVNSLPTAYLQLTAPSDPGNYAISLVGTLDGQSYSASISYSVNGDGECGDSHYSCNKGESSYIYAYNWITHKWEDQSSKDTSASWNWNCSGYGSGVTPLCSENKPKVDAECGTSHLTYPTDARCLKGEVHTSEATQSGNNWSWTCYGTGGGKDASCTESLVKPVCGRTHYTCDSGVSSSPSNNFYYNPTDLKYYWYCSLSGLSQSCEEIISKGQCGTIEKNTCISGTVSNETENLDSFSWKCNGGASDSTYDDRWCYLNKPVNGVCSNYILGECEVGNSSGVGSNNDWTCSGYSGGTAASCKIDTSKDMYGNIVFNGCTIPANGSSCQGSYSWNVYNPEVVEGSSIWSEDGSNLANGDSGSRTITLTPSKSESLSLKNNGKYLAGAYNYGTCVNSYGWDETQGKCLAKVNGTWTDWSPATSTCGVGTFYQTRTCVGALNGGTCPSDGYGTSRSVAKTACGVVNTLQLIGPKVFNVGAIPSFYAKMINSSWEYVRYNVNWNGTQYENPSNVEYQYYPTGTDFNGKISTALAQEIKHKWEAFIKPHWVGGTYSYNGEYDINPVTGVAVKRMAKAVPEVSLYNLPGGYYGGSLTELWKLPFIKTIIKVSAMEYGKPLVLSNVVSWPVTILGTTVSLTSDKSSVNNKYQYETATLTWSATNSKHENCRANFNISPQYSYSSNHSTSLIPVEGTNIDFTSGMAVVGAGFYSITCPNKEGTSADTASVYISEASCYWPQSCSTQRSINLYATPSSIQKNESSVLSWTIHINDLSGFVCKITNNKSEPVIELPALQSVDTVGNLSVNPSSTTEYKLECVKGGVNLTSPATVTLLDCSPTSTDPLCKTNECPAGSIKTTDGKCVTTCESTYGKEACINIGDKCSNIPNTPTVPAGYILKDGQCVKTPVIIKEI